MTRDKRRGTVAVSVEGSNRAVYLADRIPAWIGTEGDVRRIDLGGGHRVTHDGPRIIYDIPEHDPLRLTAGDSIAMHLPGEQIPDFVNASDRPA
ncbi:MAG: hypothetical protein FJX25_14815 [Alphaproteobacteria bacterium]|nr:hypothetical protein [Alphaproteobacteria bacterium]